MNSDAVIIETDATDIEGLATPIAPPIVNGMTSQNGAANGKAPSRFKQMATHGSLWTIAGGDGTSQVLRFAFEPGSGEAAFPPSIWSDGGRQQHHARACDAVRRGNRAVDHPSLPSR